MEPKLTYLNLALPNLSNCYYDFKFSEVTEALVVSVLYIVRVTQAGSMDDLSGWGHITEVNQVN